MPSWRAWRACVPNSTRQGSMASRRSRGPSKAGRTPSTRCSTRSMAPRRCCRPRPERPGPVALVETNVISELMRRAPDAQVLRWLERTPQIAVSVITVDEIVFGLTRRALQPLRQRFDEFLANLQVLDIDHRIARRAGELRGALAARGIARSQPDMLIAA
ncbi:MAG: type II toxin-antitoxin system VapC family toxin, partial [Comamonadaceae bacterium]